MADETERINPETKKSERRVWDAQAGTWKWVSDSTEESAEARKKRMEASGEFKSSASPSSAPRTQGKTGESLAEFAARQRKEREEAAQREGAKKALRDQM